MIIYKAQNKINGMIYIGQTIKTLEDRIKRHLQFHNKCYFPKVLYKYGVDIFEFKIIDNAMTKEELNNKEIFWIAFFNCQFPNGYNLTAGGDANPMSHPWAIQKMKESKKGQIPWNKGIPQSEETKQKNREFNIGRKHSKETLQKMSKSHSGSNNSFFGKNHTEEAKIKNRDAHLGKIYSDEIKAKLSEMRKGDKNSFFGKKHTEETKKKNREAHLGKKTSEKTKEKLREICRKRKELKAKVECSVQVLLVSSQELMLLLQDYFLLTKDKQFLNY